jgi:biopolymer transport protein ExbD
MAMQVGQADDDDLNSQINTTPLVDVMLVLLIIFLITIPVVVQNVPVDLPHERNVPTQTKPENIVMAVDRDGNVFWNNGFVDDAQLFRRLKEVAVRLPQPEVHIRGDREGRYEFVGRVVYNCQRAGILKIGFITEPPPRSG